jgi:very-short-patch-repair endonuclease
MDVCDWLRSSGYKVESQIKVGSNRIDLAIVDNKGNYVLAIECDGPHHDIDSRREMDYYRQNFLESRKWVFYRIPWVNWTSEQEETKAELIRVIDSRLGN